MANDALLAILRRLEMEPIELLKRINDMAHKHKEEEADRRFKNKKDKDAYKEQSLNARRTGKGKNNTYGLSRAWLYNVLAGNHKVSA